MAFRELVEGEVCGDSNSLLHLTSHYVQDHGLKEEGIRQPFRESSSETFQTPDAAQMVQQFLEEPACPQTFRMNDLLQEMKEIDQNIHPPQAENLKYENFDKNLIAELKKDIDNVCGNYYIIDELQMSDIWNEPYSLVPKAEEGPIDLHHEFGLDPKWAEDFLECANVEPQDCIFEDDVAKAMEDREDFMFEKQEKEDDVATENNRIPIDLTVIKATDAEWVEQYNESILGLIQDEKDAIMNKLEEELEAAGTWIETSFTEDQDPVTDSVETFTEDQDPVIGDTDLIWSRFQDEWDKISENAVSSTHPWVSEFDTYYDPFNKEYDFSETNPMKDLPNALAEGKRRLEAGDLPSAVLCFETAAQQDENNVEAWLLLGKTQAENEQDPLAISALNRCLCLDPSNSVALMALAASYANESYQKQACLTLKEWLLKNEKYKHLIGSESNLKKEEHPNFSVSTLLYEKIYDEVKDLYIQAARINPTDEIDADVQCGLGILFNLSNDYNKAVDCFQAALHVRPEDSRLWNRLGATLANGQRSAEAVNAYHRALELSPGFIRARYNLGISCVNLGAYKEAGEHLLTALNQQAAGRGPEERNVSPKAMSNTIWSTLRLVVSLMHKYELIEAIENRDLSKLNKEFEIM